MSVQKRVTGEMVSNFDTQQNNQLEYDNINYQLSHYS